MAIQTYDDGGFVITRDDTLQVQTPHPPQSFTA